MIHPALTQLASVGVVWVAFHCVGMCGPIVGGVIGGAIPSSTTASSSTRAALSALSRYQLGRLVGLSSLGAVVGGLGATLSDSFSQATSVVALVMAVVLWAGAVSSTSTKAPDVAWISLHRRGRRGLSEHAQRVVGVAGAVLLGLAQRLSGRPFAFGVAMSLLPCMIVVWALSLAATTQSAWGGAQVMALLVAMTTVPLLPAVVGTRLAIAVVRWPWLVRAPRLISAGWLLLVGLAGFGVIDHHHVVVDLAGARTIMLW